MEFAQLAEHILKLKETEKRDRYLDLARELKRRWNINVAMKLIVIGAPGTVTEGFLNGMDDVEIRERV